MIDIGSSLDYQNIQDTPRGIIKYIRARVPFRINCIGWAARHELEVRAVDVWVHNWVVSGDSPESVPGAEKSSDCEWQNYTSN